MNAKAAKDCRRLTRAFGYDEKDTRYMRNRVTGEIKLVPKCGRDWYKHFKRKYGEL